jgi:hypothetical protein
MRVSARANRRCRKREHDLDALADAFALLDQIVAARLRRGLTTVVNTPGFDAGPGSACPAKLVAR